MQFHFYSDISFFSRILWIQPKNAQTLANNTSPGTHKTVTTMAQKLYFNIFIFHNCICHFCSIRSLNRTVQQELADVANGESTCYLSCHFHSFCAKFCYKKDYFLRNKTLQRQPKRLKASKKTKSTFREWIAVFGSASNIRVFDSRTLQWAMANAMLQENPFLQVIFIASCLHMLRLSSQPSVVSTGHSYSADTTLQIATQTVRILNACEFCCVIDCNGHNAILVKPLWRSPFLASTDCIESPDASRKA